MTKEAPKSSKNTNIVKINNNQLGFPMPTV